MGEHENGVVEATATEIGTDVARHEPVPPPTTLFRTDDPVEVVERASRVADALKGVLDRQGLTANIQGKRHVLVEGWTTLGAMVGVTAVPAWTRPLEGTAPQGRVFGWEARVEARTLDSRVIGAAEAMCTRDERRWKTAEDYAVRSMAQCVPLRTRILTKRGWVTHEDARVGESVLAYDVATDKCVWTPLRNITVYGPEPLVRLANRSFDFACTYDHSWAVLGATGRRSLARSFALGARQIVVAAPAPGGEHPIDERSAEVLGWLITDGTIRYDRKGYVRAQIDQSKPQHLDRLRELLDGWATEHVSAPTGERTFPAGVTYATRQVHRFNLRAERTRELLALVGIHGKGEVVTAATEFSVAARRAMLRAMLAADGARKISEGGFEGGRYRFSKQSPAAMETFRLLATLEGHALGRLSGFELVTGAWQPAQTLRANRLTTARSLRRSEEPPEPVWCPTTDYGTWVCEQDGNVAITGNTRATSKALRGPLGFVVTLAGYQATPAEEMPTDATVEPASTPQPQPAAEQVTPELYRSIVESFQASTCAPPALTSWLDEHQAPTGDGLHERVSVLDARTGRALKAWLDDQREAVPA